MPSPWFRIGLLAICAAFYTAAGARPAPAGQAGAASRAASSESHSATLLVFPFENESHIANLDWLGEGLSELTAERLQDRGASVLSRQDRLAALEKMGLPDSARFSHATLVKIAGEADADVVIYGRFVSDGKTVTLEARVLHISPPSLVASLDANQLDAGFASRARASDVADFMLDMMRARNCSRLRERTGTKPVFRILRRRCVWTRSRI